MISWPFFSLSAGLRKMSRCVSYLSPLEMLKSRGTIDHTSCSFSLKSIDSTIMANNDVQLLAKCGLHAAYHPAGNGVAQEAWQARGIQCIESPKAYHCGWCRAPADHPAGAQRMLADYFRKSQFRRLRCALWTAGANCRKMAWTDWEAFIAR